MSSSPHRTSAAPESAAGTSGEGHSPTAEAHGAGPSTREGPPQPIRVGDLLAVIECTVELAARTGRIDDQVSASLEQIATGLETWSSAYHAQARQTEQLTRRCDEIEAAAAKEKQFLIDQQDQFLASLLDDHERSVEALQTECDRAWRKVGDLQARVAGQEDAPAPSAATAKRGERQELSREVLLRAKQQRDEAQRQTIEALSRLQSALTEIERLRTFAAPSTLPPGPELPISMPPEEPLQPPAVPVLGQRTPSTQPAGWRRSVPPVRRESLPITPPVQPATVRVGPSADRAPEQAPEKEAAATEQSRESEPPGAARNGVHADAGRASAYLDTEPPDAADDEEPQPSRLGQPASSATASPGSYSMPAARAVRGSEGAKRGSR